MLEQGTVELLHRHRPRRAAATARALVHHGVELRFDGEGHRIDLSELTGGRTITVYGQQEVVKDLIAARLRDGGDDPASRSPTSRSTASTTERPTIAFTHDGEQQTLECDVIAGCDGFHGICRPSIPAGELTEYDRTYPFGWLGILARAAPSSDELDLRQPRRAGFALLQHALARGRAACTCSASPTRTSTTGPTSASGTSSTPAWRRRDGVPR